MAPPNNTANGESASYVPVHSVPCAPLSDGVSADDVQLKTPLIQQRPSSSNPLFDGDGRDEEEDVDMIRPATNEGLVRNFVFMAVLFGLNHGCVTSLISLSSVELGDLGTYTNGTLYVVYTFTAAVLSHAVTARFGHKRTLVFGVSLYCLYVLAYLIAALAPSVKAPAVITGGALGGFAAGFLWPAQGSYFTTTARLYAKGGGAESVAAANAKFSSIFAFFYLFCEVLLKIVASLTLNNEDKWKGGKTLVYVVLAITAGATAVGMTFISKLAPRNENAGSRGPIPVGKLALSAFSLLVKDPKCALMVPMNFTFGFAAAYLNSYIGPNVVAADGGIGGANVPYLAAVLVGSATLITFAFGKIGKTTLGKVLAAMLGAVAFGTFVLVFAVLPVERQISVYGDSWTKLVLLYALYGMGRSAWEGPFKATFADFFPNDKEAAFANVQLQSGFASTIGFFAVPKLLEMDDSAFGVPGSVILGGVAIISAVLALAAQPISYAIYKREEKARQEANKKGALLI